MKKYKTIVYIGRFRPPHRAHIQTMRQALEQADRLIVLCGSANQARTTKNPWTVSEVDTMIRACLQDVIPDSNYIAKNRLSVVPLNDVLYNDQAWVSQVQRLVGGETDDDDIAIIGHSKDESSYYLKMFPQWDFIEVDNIEDIHATDVRNAMFDANGSKFYFADAIGNRLPEEIHTFIDAFMMGRDYFDLVNEHQFLKAHKRMWADAPYPPTFVCVDAVVVQSGHVLLIRRRAEPGRGLFAIPGGYINQHERLEDAMIRELREETKIKVPGPVLRGSIKSSGVYDAPSRSPRGRIISHAYLIELPPGPLPAVKGSDDADKARWVPISTFERMEPQMFEDHFAIISDLLGRL